MLDEIDPVVKSSDGPPVEVTKTLSKRLGGIFRELWGRDSVSLSALQDAVWGDEEVEPESVEKQIKRLREKLEPFGYAIETKAGTVSLERLGGQI